MWSGSDVARMHRLSGETRAFHYVKTGSHRTTKTGTRSGTAYPFPKKPRPTRPYPKKGPGRPTIPRPKPTPPPAPQGVDAVGKALLRGALRRNIGVMLARELLGAIMARIRGELTSFDWSHPRYVRVECSPPRRIDDYTVNVPSCGSNTASFRTPTWPPPDDLDEPAIRTHRANGIITSGPLAGRMSYTPSGGYNRVTTGDSGSWEPALPLLQYPSVGRNKSADVGGRVPPYPQLDPMAMPVAGGIAAGPGLPIPFPVIPHRRPSAWRVDQPGGSQPTTPPPPRPPVPLPPNHLPAWEVVLGRAPRSGRHVLRKPTRRERERKFIMTPSKTAVAMVVINVITEALDALNAVYGTLPKDIRARVRHRPGWPPTPSDKAAAVFENLDRLDVRAVMDALVKDQLEDALFGALGKLSAQAARNAHAAGHSDLRPQLGPADTPEQPSFPGQQGIIEDAIGILQKLVDVINGKDLS